MIGLIDVDGKLPNLALMKISKYYKGIGEQVEFAQPGKQYEKVYASCLFSWNRIQCQKILQIYPDAEIGGTGWDLKKKLPIEIEACKPDYDLYTAEMIYSKSCVGGISSKETKLKKAQTIANMGIGFTSRGCIRECGFCVVSEKEGKLHKVAEIRDIINPKSNVITLYDNNLTADPNCIDKLREIKDRGLVVDISQGIDVRILTDEIALALSRTRHLRSLHYAWDLMNYENKVIDGIKILKRHVKPWRHMCYVLTGYNTTFEEDIYRVKKLDEMGIRPYIMKYNNLRDDVRLNHFARWVNGRFHKACNFEEYIPWAKIA